MEGRQPTPIAADLHICFTSLIGEAVFHRQQDGAAERVEAEGRIVRDELRLVDGVRRDEVPIHDVAEGFVDANPVLIDGEAFGRAAHGRGIKAPIIDVGLKFIARDAVHRHARQLAVERVGDGRAARSGDFGARDGAHRRRHLVGADGARARGGRRHDLDLGQDHGTGRLPASRILRVSDLGNARK